jgi:hypothetical protein
LKDCIDDRAVRYDREGVYDIDPENPCAIYFDLPKEGRLIAIQAEKQRRIKTLQSQKELGRSKSNLSKADPNEFDAEIASLKPEEAKA